MKDVPERYFPFPLSSEPRAFWRCPTCGLVTLEEHLPTVFIPRYCPMHRRAGEGKVEMLRHEILATQIAPRQPRGDSHSDGAVYMRIGGKDSKLHIYSGHGGDLAALRPITVCGRRGGAEAQLLRRTSPGDEDLCENCRRDARDAALRRGGVG